MHQKEEKLSLDMLKNNGLIQKPLVVKQNYAHFEIVEQQPKQIDSLFSRNHSVKSRTVSSSDNGSLSSESNLKKLPPARLLKLEKNAKPAMTSDQIEEKILKANQRKKVKIYFNYGFLENKSRCCSMFNLKTFYLNTA